MEGYKTLVAVCIANVYVCPACVTPDDSDHISEVIETWDQLQDSATKCDRCDRYVLTVLHYEFNVIAPLTVEQAGAVAATSAYEMAHNPILAEMSYDEAAETAYAWYVGVIARGWFEFSYTHGTHVHMVFPGRDPWYTCFRCYGD